MAGHDDKLQAWIDRVPAYVEGELDDKLALELVLVAEREPAVARALEQHRGFLSTLDRLGRAEPAPGFDDRILASVPYERYASAPRRAKVQLVLEGAPGVVGEAARGLGGAGTTLWGVGLVAALVAGLARGELVGTTLPAAAALSLLALAVGVLRARSGGGEARSGGA